MSSFSSFFNKFADLSEAQIGIMENYARVFFNLSTTLSNKKKAKMEAKGEVFDESKNVMFLIRWGLVLDGEFRGNMSSYIRAARDIVRTALTFSWATGDPSWRDEYEKKKNHNPDRMIGDHSDSSKGGNSSFSFERRIFSGKKPEPVLNPALTNGDDLVNTPAVNSEKNDQLLGTPA
jgi:hypothetical protein